MTNPKIPTLIVDKNGKVTTVYTTNTKPSRKKQKAAAKKAVPIRTTDRRYIPEPQKVTDVPAGIGAQVMLQLGVSKNIHRELMDSEDEQLLREAVYKHTRYYFSRNLIDDFDRFNQSTLNASIARRLLRGLNSLQEKLAKSDLPHRRRAKHIYLAIVSSADDPYNADKYPLEVVDSILEDSATLLLSQKGGMTWEQFADMKHKGIDPDLAKSVLGIR